MLALLRQLKPACPTADDLAEAVEEAFSPDAEVILSIPGLQLRARVLAEIGDDQAASPTRAV